MIWANYVQDKNARLGRFPESRGKVAANVYPDKHPTMGNDNTLTNYGT